MQTSSRLDFVSKTMRNKSDFRERHLFRAKNQTQVCPLLDVTQKRETSVKKTKREETSLEVHAQSTEILAMSYYEFNHNKRSRTLISDGERQFFFFFFYAIIHLFPFCSLSSQQKDKPSSRLSYFPQTFRRLSRLVRTTSMIIRFCIAKCLCVYV